MNDVKNIVQFIIDATTNSNLLLNFKAVLTNSKSLNELKSFFETNNYIVSEEECLRILENKDRVLQADGIQPNY